MEQSKKLHFSIFTVVILIILFITALRIFYQYRFGQELAYTAVKSSLESVVKNIMITNHYFDQNNQTILEVAEDFNGVFDAASHHKQPLIFKSFIKMLKRNEHIISMYIGHENGDFIQVVNLSDHIKETKAYHSPTNTRWIISTISTEDNHQTRLFRYYDKNLRFISQKTSAHNLTPTSRPWYKAAIKTNKVIKTPPYSSQELKNVFGITYAKQLINHQAVIGIDITTSQLNQLLTKQKPTNDAEIFIYDPDGRKLFSSEFIPEKEYKISTKPIILTTEEKNYIKHHPILYASNEINWYPFDYNEGGIAKGYSIDLLALISAKTELKIIYTNGLEWDQLLAEFKQAKIDLVHSLYYSNERKKYGTFSKPYYTLKHYFITKEKMPTIRYFEQLKGYKVAVVKGWKITQYLEKNVPNISLIYYSNALSVLRAVSNHEADIAIDAVSSVIHLTKRYSINNLKLNHPLPYDSKMYQEKLHIMLQPDKPILQSIINKALASISIKEQAYLIKKWHLDQNKVNNKQDNHVVDESFLSLSKQHKPTDIFELTINNKAYYTSYQMLNDSNWQTSLGILMEKTPLMSPYYDKIINSILLSLFILLICLVIIYYFLIKPIQKISFICYLVKKRQYHKINLISNPITEFNKLSESLFEMSNSIAGYEKNQKEILRAVIQLFAETIDAKSPFTAKHCKRVPVIAKMLLDAANKDQESIFKDFSMTSESDLHAYELGTWLHDCGKVTTPEHIINKATKLETIYNRIHEIRTRFEVLWRDADIIYYQALLVGTDKKIAQSAREKTRQNLQDDYQFIAECNIGGEFMSEKKQQRVIQIAKKTWIRHFDDHLGLSALEQYCLSGEKSKALPHQESLLDNKSCHQIDRENFDLSSYKAHGFKLDVPKLLYNHGEIYNLCIAKGTLTAEERFKINEHIIMTIKMLEKIPFPDGYGNIMEYAGTHHETLIGTGYPRKLHKKDMSIPARIMIIADIFEALTASDRPYKKAKTLTESLDILKSMVDIQHIDHDIFILFLRSGVYLEYAKKYLNPEQIDKVDITTYL